MSDQTTRWVVLDGGSSAFEFKGTWETESYPSHMSTMETTRENGSEMVFKFNGALAVSSLLDKSS